MTKITPSRSITLSIGLEERVINIYNHKSEEIKGIIVCLTWLA